MRRHTGGNPGVALVLLHKALPIGKRLIRVFKITGFLFHYGFSRNTTNPHLIHCTCSLRLEIIHIKNCGDPGQQHFRRGIFRRKIDELGIHGPLFHRQKKYSQTVLAVVAQPPKRYHPHMRMKVYHTRHEDSALPVDQTKTFPCFIFCFIVRFLRNQRLQHIHRSNRGDLSAFPCGKPVLYHFMRFIHRHHSYIRNNCTHCSTTFSSCI